MLRLALRGIAAHKLRLAATALAVMLGVGFVAGTFVLTDTLRAAVNGALTHAAPNAAVVVQSPSTSGGTSQAFAIGGATIPQSVTAQVRAVPGVAAAQAVATGPVDLVGSNGHALSSPTATVVLSVGTVPALRSLTLRQGHYPVNGSQAVIDVASAHRWHLHVGALLHVAEAGAAYAVRLVGTVGYGSADTLAGATLVGLTLPATQAVLGTPGRVYEVRVQAQPGVSDQQLRSRVAAALGPEYQVQTGAQATAQITGNIDRGFNVFGDVLLVFAGVALFVAIFLIFNTFSILLAQRAREMALLRCLGAHRAQLARSALMEASIVGLGASAVGLGFGIVVALAIRALLQVFGIGLPAVAPVVAPRTVVVALVVGTLATVVAALVPAIRASRTAPMAAFHDEPAVDMGRPPPLRIGLGIVLVIVGAVVVTRALHGSGTGGDAAFRAEMAAAGLVVGFLGLAALVPVVARPLAGAIGWPLARCFGVAGQLGRRNAMRNPRRTASTAAALMIGLTLVTTVAVFANSVEASTNASLDKGLTASVVVSPRGVPTLSLAMAARLRQAPEIRAATALSSGTVLAAPGVPTSHSPKLHVRGADIAAYRHDVSTPVVAGRLSAIQGTDVGVTTGVADQFALHVGSSLELAPTAGDGSGPQAVRVVAIFHDPSGLTDDVLTTTALASALFPQPPQVDLVLAQPAPGQSAGAAVAAAARALRGYPQARVETKAQYMAREDSQFQQLIGLVTALLGLAVLIALCGVVNTLVLSAVERTREIGLLRAMGLSRRQLRASVRWESVVVSFLGAVLGVGLGLVFGWVVCTALRSDGLDVLSVPTVELVAFVVLSGVAGMVAAVVPARAAARTNILEAIATE